MSGQPENPESQKAIISAFESFKNNSSMLLMNFKDVGESEELQKTLRVVRGLEPYVDSIAQVNVQVFDLVVKAVKGLSKIQHLGTGGPIPKEKLREIILLLEEVEGYLVDIEESTPAEELSAGSTDSVETSPDTQSPNLLQKHYDAFTEKEQDYRPRYQKVKDKLESKSKLAGNFTERAKNALRLLARIFSELEANFDGAPMEDAEMSSDSFLGILVLLEQALGVQKETYRGSVRGVRGLSEDILSQLDALDDEANNKLEQRWQNIADAVAVEAQKSKQARRPKSGLSYSNERRAMMREIIERFGNLDLKDQEAGAVLDLLETVLDVQTSENYRVSRSGV